MQLFPLIWIGVCAAKGSPSTGGGPSEGPVEPALLPASRVWVASDYVHTRDAMAALSPDELARLPTLEGHPESASLRRMCDPKALDRALKGADVDTWVEVLGAVNDIGKQYTIAASTRSDLAPEMLCTAALSLYGSARAFDMLITALELSPATLEQQPVRFEGLQKMRVGMVEMLQGLLLIGSSAPEALVDRLHPILPVVAPLLLPEETVAARAAVERIGTDRKDPRWEVMLALLDETRPRHPMVSGFLAEHRAYTLRYQQRPDAVQEAVQRPTIVGPEPGGIRYAWEDGEFSAVFDVPPNASEQESPTETGGRLRVRTLGVRDLDGFSRSVICFSRTDGGAPSPLGPEVLTKMGAANVDEAEVAGHRGWRAELRSETSVASVLVLPTTRSGCLVVAECPVGMESSTVAARRDQFLASVRIHQP